MNTEEIKTFSRLDRINHVLLINGSAIKDVTLGYGKCGFALYFFYLFKKTGNLMYKKLADQLLDEMSEGIDLRIPIELATGFTGMGCTVEYLAQSNFIDADTDDILEAFDQRVERIFRNEYCGETALCHIFYYLVMRYSNINAGRNAEIENSLSALLRHSLMLIDRNLSASPQLGNDELDKFELLWNLPLTLLAVQRLQQLSFDLESLNRLNEKLHRAASYFLNSDIHPLNKWYLSVVLNRVSAGSCVPIWRLRDIELPEQLDLQHGVAGVLLLTSLFDDSDQIVKQELITRLTDAEFDKESPFAGYKLPETSNRFYKLGLLEGVAGIGFSQLT